MSIKDPPFVYIGETKYIKTQLPNHNRQLRLYADATYVCDFDDNHILPHHIEQQWKLSVHSLTRRYLTDVEKVARSASDIIDLNNTLIDATSPVQLNLILLFRE